MSITNITQFQPKESSYTIRYQHNGAVSITTVMASSVRHAAELAKDKLPTGAIAFKPIKTEDYEFQVNWRG